MSSSTAFRPQDQKIYLLPFGGLGQFGANMLGLFSSGKLYIIDCGVSFPDARKLGVDAIVPDCISFIENLGGVEAYFITHGHEDHIGALPIMYRYFQAPIYATSWTSELIRQKFARFNFSTPPDMKRVDYGTKVTCNDLELEWVYMTHSLPEASSLYIRTPYCRIFHTGDFKIDPDPVVGPLCDFAALERLRDEGIDIMLCDSTNANKSGSTGTENSILNPLTQILKESSARVFLTCFSSNVARIQTAITACAQAERKLCLMGASLENVLGMAQDVGLLQDPQNTVCGLEEARYLESHKICFLLTGSQGEYRGSLARFVYGELKGLRVEPKDLFIFSSRIIPGNEKTVLNLMNEIERIGAHAITNRTHPDIHVSGHAHADEIEQLINILKPSLFVPVHGTYLHLNQNRAIGNKWAPKKLEWLIANGDVLSIDKNLKIENDYKLEFDRLFIDAFSKSILSPETLRERLRIGEQGLVILNGHIAKSKKWLAPLEINLVGLSDTMYYSVSEIESRIVSACQKTLQKLDMSEQTQEDLREALRLTTRRIVHEIYGRKAVVLSLVQLAR